MPADCSLCSLRPGCDGAGHRSDVSAAAPLLLHAASPILADRVGALLIAHQVAHQRCGNRFEFAPASSPQRIAATLRANLVEAERSDLRLGYATLDGLLRADDLDVFCRKLETGWFEQALAADTFTFYYQPIVDITGGEVFAHECLVRLESERLYEGGEIIDAMLVRGEVHRFDSYCRQKAIRSAARQHRAGQKVFINFQPSSIYDPAHCLRSTLAALSETHLTAEDIVFEVVETEEVRQLGHLKRIAEYYRAQRFGFALDDAGAGANTLAMVQALRPDYVKLDKSLTRNIGRSDLSDLRPMLDQAHALGCRVIAEGVESNEMAAALAGLGVTLMQGWHYGRPSPQMNAAAGGRRLFRSAAGTEQLVVLPSAAPAASSTISRELSDLAASVAAAGTETSERLRLLESVVVHCDEVVIITELDPLAEPGPRILYVNPAFTRVTGYTPGEVIGRSPRLLQGPATDRGELDRIRARLSRHEPVQAELINYGKDGTEYWIEINIVPVHNEAGQPLHAIAIQRDISERKRVERQLAHQATHDPLTGLANRRFLLSEIDARVDRGRTSPHAAPLCVCICDIDGFKQVNDSYGHAVGDEVLVGVARVMRDHLPPGGMAGRLGGDELCLVLPTSPGESPALLERLRSDLASRVYRAPGGVTFHIAASFGWVAWDGNQTMRDLLALADQALYTAKQQGRNRVFAAHTLRAQGTSANS